MDWEHQTSSRTTSEEGASSDWTVVLPELDRLHILLAESLELCSHWLIAVPEGLSVCLSGLGLWDLNPRGDVKVQVINMTSSTQ